MRTGIFGGCFDPVHNGHLLAALDVLERLRLDRMLFLLSARPPHKNCVLPWARRRALLRLALRPYPAFELSSIEDERPGPSFTVDTLAMLHRSLPRDRLFLVIGTDQHRELRTWKFPERLTDYADLVVLARPGVRAVRRRAGIRFLRVRQVEISSSEVRSRIRADLSVRNMLPDAVHRAIVRDRLYQTTR
jgi:nicotinate-nucleotide adenylyltransferase